MSWISKAKTGLQLTVATVAVLLVTDLIASTLLPQALINVFGEGSLVRISSPTYHHDLRPNVDVQARWGQLTHRLCTDAHGFKSPCDLNQEQKSNPHYDIAFIGDSFTEAMGMPYEQSFVGLYAQAHPNLRVANLAVSSYAPSIYLKKVEAILAQGITFNELVVLPDISDIQDEAIFYKIRHGVVEDIIPSGMLVNASRRFQERFGRYFSMTSNLFLKVSQDLERFFNKRNGTIKKTVKTNYPDHPRAHWTFTPDSNEYGDAGVEGGVSQAVASMRQLKMLLDKHHIKLVIAVYPWDTQLKHGDSNHRGVTVWRDFCKDEHCARFVDLNAAFFSEVKHLGLEGSIQKYQIPGDTHFNESGNRLIFENLNQKLSESN